MKARLTYPLLFMVPCIVVALSTAALAGASIGAVLWIYVYGDEPWPKTAEALMVGAAVLVAGIVFAVLLWLLYSIGRKREAIGALAPRHVALAIFANILTVLFCLHQWQNNPGLAH